MRHRATGALLEGRQEAARGSGGACAAANNRACHVCPASIFGEASRRENGSSSARRARACAVTATRVSARATRRFTPPKPKNARCARAQSCEVSGRNPSNASRGERRRTHVVRRRASPTRKSGRFVDAELLHLAGGIRCAPRSCYVVQKARHAQVDLLARAKLFDEMEGVLDSYASHL